MAIEINDVSPNGVLPSELEAQFSSAEMLPEDIFGLCTEVSVMTGVVE